MSREHEWGPSRVNHASSQCIHCHCTDREASFALGPLCPARKEHATRKIVGAEVGMGRLSRTTFIFLDCGHDRALGGHTFNGEVLLPGELIGRAYPCRDGLCGSRRA